jgi:hypothetical protein
MATKPRVPLQKKPSKSRKRRLRTNLFPFLSQIQHFPWGINSEWKTMLDPLRGHEHLRLSVTWLLRIRMDCGEVNGEARN